MSLSSLQNDGYRILYFSPLASHREFSVSTRILRDSTRLEESFHDFNYFPEERAGNAHTTSRVMSETGVQLFNLIDQNAVGCWDSALPYTPKNHDIVDRDDETLVFPADVKIDETNTVWVISDRMPVFLIAELDYTDVNFRIFSASLDNLLQGTVCNPRNKVTPYNRFSSPIAALPAVPQQQPSYNYLDLPSDPLTPETLSPGYPELKGLGYVAPEVTHQQPKALRPYTAPPTHNSIVIPPTQPSISVPAPSKAYVFNQHNGVAIKTETPAYYHFLPQQPNYYRPRTPAQQSQSNNQWNPKKQWSNHQFYY